MVPFFEAHPLRTVKRSSSECFAEVIRLVQRGGHLTTEGAGRSNESRFSESSEAIRRISDLTVGE